VARRSIRSLVADRVAGHIAPADRAAWLIALCGLLAASLAIQSGSVNPAVGVLAAIGPHAAMLAGAWATARRLRARRAEQPAAAVDGLLAGLIYFVGVIFPAMFLGLMGLLTRPALLAGMAVTSLLLLRVGAGHAALASAWRALISHDDRSLVLAIHGGIRPGRPARIAALAVACLGVATRLLILLAAWQCLAAPEYVYDALNYHLTFAAQWAQTGRLAIVSTWLGDPAPSYAPAAMDVYFTTLLLPAGSDALARCGQFPGYLLLVLALGTLAGALRVNHLAAATLIMIAAGLPGIAAQAASAMVDVALAAFLMAGVAFALRLLRSRSVADFCGLALSTGLAAGTKYLALLYLVAFAPLPALAAWRFATSRRSGIPRPAGAAAASGAAVLAGLWIGGYGYARNSLLTGNPLYPLRVQIAGVIILDGAFGREQMENHVMNARREAVLAPLGRVLWQAISSAGRQDASAASSSGAPAWRGAIILCGLALLFAIRTWRSSLSARRRIGPFLFCLGSAAGLALFWLALPVQDFRYAWCPLLMVMTAAASGLQRSRTALVVGTGVALALGLMVFHATITRVAQCWILRGDARDRAFDAPRWAAIAPAWRFIDLEVRGRTIGYSGNNVPYFLYGRRLENRVVYVPARRPMLARYDQWARLPESRALGPPQTSEPTFDRWLMDPAAWIENLRELAVEYFVVNSLELCPNLTLNVRHDAEGFPVERAWLDALARAGAADRILFGDPRVRVYRLRLEALRRLPAEMAPVRQEETDALDRARRAGIAPTDPIPDYPLARPYIRRHRLGIVTDA